MDMVTLTHINMREGCHMKIEAGKRYMISRDAKGVITRFPVTVTYSHAARGLPGIR